MRRFTIPLLVLLASTATGCLATEGDLADDTGEGEGESALCNSPDPLDCKPAPTSPPPTLPPVPSPGAGGAFFTQTSRTAIRLGVDKFIADYNASHSGKLSWRSAKPDDCGYTCASAVGWPNTTYPYVRQTVKANLQYKGWHYGLYVTRYVTIDFTISGNCVGWQDDGVGDLRVGVTQQQPTFSGGSWISGLYENVIDFFGNGHLTRYINEQFHWSLDSDPSTTGARVDSCRSLGVQSFYPGVNWKFDAIIWDQ